jgi:RND superfamily putative drug exporter
MAMFFTPALTALIGRTAWWPGHADTGKPRASLDQTDRQSLAPSRSP